MYYQKLFELVSNFKINITEEEILDILQMERRWPYCYFDDVENPKKHTQGFNVPVQVIGANDAVKMNYFYSRDGFLIFDEWKKTYDMGFTTMLSNILDIHKDLRDLRDEIFEYSGIKVYANLYLTNGGVGKCSPSWTHHNHQYPVIVKTIYGDVEWKLDDENITLSSGNTMFIKPEVNHSVINCPNKRLSLTINL